MFGNRDLELEVNWPTGRVLRFEYKGQRSVAFGSVADSQFDEDDDQNNDREFNGVAKFYWDFGRQPSRFVQINARRDNYAQTNSKLTIEVLNIQGLKSQKLIVDRQRLYNESRIQFTTQYELDSGASNQLDLTFRMSSDLDSNFLSSELSLQRPKFNILYENQFNKLTGKLQQLNLRLGRLLRVRIQKNDPENRKISVELASPSADLYSVESKIVQNTQRYFEVESTLRDLKSQQVLSVLKSNFDSNNNRLALNLDAQKSSVKYQLSFGVFSELLARAELLKNEEMVGVASLGVDLHEKSHADLELTLRWNRVWSQFRQDVLGQSKDALGKAIN